MKYRCTVDINVPLAKTIALWQDEKYFKEWQDGFDSIEHLRGSPNQKGAVSKIIYKGDHQMELMETIISNDLPEKKIALYEHVDMTNTQTTRFEAIDKNTTRYTSEVEYTKFNKFLIRLMAKLFPGTFKGQSQKWMNQFKEFAEKKEN